MSQQQIEKVGIDLYTKKVPFWQFWNRCKGCGGRSFVESKAVLKNGICNVYTCLNCGMIRNRKI